MDPGRFFASSRVLIVAGKGGVGKTTVAATIATAAAECGLSVLLVEVAGRSAAAPMFGAGPQGYAETILVPAAGAAPGTGGGRSGSGAIRGRSITSDEALTEWLSRHGFKRIVKRMARSGVLEVIATATPGIRELLVLGRIKALEADRAADLIVVDAPAAGQALGFLRSAVGVRDAARSGALHRQAVEVLELLGDPARCRVVLVAIAEETPVSETIETAFAVEDEVGVSLGPVVVNGVLAELDGLDADLSPDGVHGLTAGCGRCGTCGSAAGSGRHQHSGPDEDPGKSQQRSQQHAVSAREIADLKAAADLRLGRQRLQAEQLTRLDSELPLPRIRLPHLFTPEIGPSELAALAEALSTELKALAP